MITADFIGEEKLDRAVAALRTVDAEFADQFRDAGEKSVRYITRDLQRGVSSISGGLKGGITGTLDQANGAEVTALVQSRSDNKGYDYGALLDNSGAYRWLRGRFRGRRTFGWFHLTLPRIGKKFFRRYYERALTEILKRIQARL